MVELRPIFDPRNAWFASQNRYVLVARHGTAFAYQNCEIGINRNVSPTQSRWRRWWLDDWSHSNRLQLTRFTHTRTHAQTHTHNQKKHHPFVAFQIPQDYSRNSCWTQCWHSDWTFCIKRALNGIFGLIMSLDCPFVNISHYIPVTFSDPLTEPLFPCFFSFVQIFVGFVWMHAV